MHGKRQVAVARTEPVGGVQAVRAQLPFQHGLQLVAGGLAGGTGTGVQHQRIGRGAQSGTADEHLGLLAQRQGEEHGGLTVLQQGVDVLSRQVQPQSRQVGLGNLPPDVPWAAMGQQPGAGLFHLLQKVGGRSLFDAQIAQRLGYRDGFQHQVHKIPSFWMIFREFTN